jgi:hypothetical protein
MDYIISPEQLDKITKPFFDKEFKDAKWGEHTSGHRDSTWYGFINQDDVLLVGHPSFNVDNYYTNGHHFENMWSLFGIDAKEFNQAIGRYIKKKYGVEFVSIR